MKNNKYKDKLKDLINLGEDQYNQVIEECSEVIKEITKMNRKKGCKADLIEEIGDLQNTLDSILYINDIDIEEHTKSRYTKMSNYVIKANEYTNSSESEVNTTSKKTKEN